MTRTTSRRRRRTSIAVALATIIASLAGCAGASPKPRSARSASAADIPAAAQATDGLAIALMERLGQTGGNVIFSPYSIETALSMVETGAAGSTATEIAHVLHTSDPAAVASGLAALDARLTAAARSRGAPQVHLASSLWVQSGLALKRPFTAGLAALFGAPPQAVDFAGSPDAARESINGWVAARTAHLIPTLFPAGTITAQTALVLANAIYLAAHWTYPFTPGETARGPFYPSTGPPVRVPFMTQTPVELGYVDGHGYRAVDLPYLHSSLSMLLIMPATGTVARFEHSLTARSLTRIGQALRPTRLGLHLPRLHLSFRASLEPVLSELGMPVAFTDAADLSGITNMTALKLSAVEHAADLRLDEQGTVAAAATGISIEPTAVAPAPATMFALDHPFLLFLRDNRTGAILFAGQVTNPA